MHWQDQGHDRPDNQHGEDRQDHDGADHAHAEPAFGIGDERLPWLEADDERQHETADTGRIIAFALVGLLAVVAIVGALWWFSRSQPDPALIADGSLIEAPDAPYKERPESPGGRDVEGTGNTSFDVAEGRRTDGRVADVPPPPPPPPAATASATPAATATAAAATGGVGVQVGAYSSRAAAEFGWNQMTNRFEALKGVSHRILEANADGGTIYRLQAVTGDRSSADALCRSLKSAGGDCQVKR
ncbi:SPOR domain-containing protein [Altererythrobacter xixiisoli]|uniref:SPOR domain-containing protein n=1 Tax=Croceibacterium xixiisoli TaxID=1476466 RepID=A0A6I4TTG3_9SPHN|nr:SPOR domain-containing protein [Croceibacterium xixiisoli]MXO98157.1 SPOR domain-containing protein [Croceibacterium xixiisoli]